MRPRFDVVIVFVLIVEYAFKLTAVPPVVIRPVLMLSPVGTRTPVSGSGTRKNDVS